MNDLIKKAFSLGLGITMTTKEKLESYVNELVTKGEVAPDESKELIAGLIQRGEEQQDEIKRIVREQLKKMLIELHVATVDDIKSLEQRIDRLEQNSKD